MIKKLFIINIILSFIILNIIFLNFYTIPSEKEYEGGNEVIEHQNPCWSPNGFQILFSSTEDSECLNLWIMNNNSSNARPLLFNGEVDSEADYVNLPGGAWSSVINNICFSSDREDNDEIWYVESDYTTLHRVTNHPAKDWEPSWSPDGEWIVFQSDRLGNWDLYKIRINGTDLKQLTNNSANDWQPCWSPDGSKILFQSDRSGNWQLYTIDNSSIESNLYDLSNNTSYEDTDGSWNPYGTWIVFSSDRSGEEPDIFIMKTDGTCKTQITNTPEYDGAPSFAPNNRTIAFESESSGDLRIWTIDVLTRISYQITD